MDWLARDCLFISFHRELVVENRKCYNCQKDQQKPAREFELAGWVKTPTGTSFLPDVDLCPRCKPLLRKNQSSEKLKQIEDLKRRPAEPVEASGEHVMHNTTYQNSAGETFVPPPAEFADAATPSFDPPPDLTPSTTSAE